MGVFIPRFCGVANTGLQCWAGYFGRGEEFRLNWTGLRDFGIYFLAFLTVVAKFKFWEVSVRLRPNLRFLKYFLTF